jgi:PAS domain-containing protein
MVATQNDLARKVIEHSVDGLLVIDADGVVQFANPAAVTLFASRTRQLTGFHLGAPASHGPVEITLAGGDSVRYVEMRSTDIPWEGRKATLAALRDITERKRAEEALQKQTEELRERNSALVSFNRAAVGRELRMIELKQEVNELCGKLGEPARHRIPGHEVSAPATPKVLA